MLLHVGIKTVAFATLFGAAHAFAGSSLFALPGDLQSEAKRSVKLALNADYKTSYQVSEKIRAKNPGAACVLRNVVRLSEFDDVGDTLALEKAAKELSEKIMPIGAKMYQQAADEAPKDGDAKTSDGSDDAVEGEVVDK